MVDSGSNRGNMKGQAGGSMKVQRLVASMGDPEFFISLLFLRFINERVDNDKNHTTFHIPETAKWSSIRNLADHPGQLEEIGDVLYRAFMALEDKNESLKGVFSAFQFRKLSDNIFEDKNFAGYYLSQIHHISSIDFEEEGFDFAELLEVVLQTFAKSKGKGGFEYYQPQELTDLMAAFAPDTDSLAVYNPFAGIASFARNLPKQAHYIGQEINLKTWALGRLRMLINDCPDHFQLNCDNSLRNWVPDNYPNKFDFVVANPPFGMRLSAQEQKELGIKAKSLESWLLYKISNSLSKTGKAVIAVRQGLLSELGSDKDIRQYLVDRDLLEMVLMVPGGILHNTNIPIALLVLNANKTEKKHTLFVDASDYKEDHKSKVSVLRTDAILELIKPKADGALCALLTSDEIQANDYNLIPYRYLGTDVERVDDAEYVSLNSILSPIERNVPEHEVGKFVRIRDLSDGPMTYLKTFEEVESKELPKHASILEEGSLLLSVRWNALKPTHYIGSSSEIAYSYSDLLACRVDEEVVNIEYLIHELGKEYVAKQLEKFRRGSTIPFISKKDLLEVQIQIIPREEQDNKVLNFKKEVLLVEESKLEDLRKNYGIDVADQNSFLRHQIAGPFKNIRGAFASIKDIVTDKYESMFEKLMVLKQSEESDLTLSKYLDIIERDLKAIHASIKRTGEELQLVDLNMEQLDIVQYLQGYCTELQSRVGDQYEVDFGMDEETLKELEDNDIVFEGDAAILRTAFDNLVENAELHAFANSDDDDKRLDINLMFFLKDRKIQIDFSNTGNPMPENFSLEAYIRKGSKAGPNAGDGAGGAYVNEVMKLHVGELDFTDERGSDGVDGGIVTTFELTFPIEIEANE